MFSFHRYLQSIFNPCESLTGGGNLGDHPAPSPIPIAPTLLDHHDFTSQTLSDVFGAHFSFVYHIVADAGIGGLDFTRYKLRVLK